MDAQTAERLAGYLPPGRTRNLRTLATALGGIPAAQYEQILHRHQPPPGLLPGVFDDYQQVSFGEFAEGVRPDILGELTAALLRLAWQASQEAYHAFVERAAADHYDTRAWPTCSTSATGAKPRPRAGGWPQTSCRSCDAATTLHSSRPSPA